MATGSANTTKAGRQYKPNAALWLIDPTANTAPFGAFGQWFQAQPNATIIRDLQIQFKIEKNLGKEPNRAELVVTNMAPESRAAAQRKPLLVRLEVGYDGQYEQIFVGDLRKGFTTRDRTDFHTHLLMGDGDRAFALAQVSQSYIPGTTVGTVLKDITDAIGLNLPAGIQGAVELNRQLEGGFVSHGPAQEQLTTILAPLGYSWSIQDNQLQIIKVGETASNLADVVSQDTGMIGSPEFGDPTKPGQPPILKVSTVVRARLKCGGTIQMQSEDINGLFRVEKLTHVGDTRGRQWKTEIEARPL